MPVCKVADSAGDTMDLYVMESKPQFFVVPTLKQDWVENIPNYPLRNDDVMLCSYTKSGCHWVWEMGRLLLDGRTKVEGTEKESSMVEANTLMGNIEDAPAPRILNSHLFFDHLPKDVVK
ncbi:amine sulfotransferase, partial [Aplysia californica]|uniref:Amine sulfotransferase n=1 Tax=Aplysia californica TaxID=6500 RepID=A0ABM1AA14_APLCA